MLILHEPQTEASEENRNAARRAIPHGDKKLFWGGGGKAGKGKERHVNIENTEKEFHCL